MLAMDSHHTETNRICLFSNNPTNNSTNHLACQLNKANWLGNVRSLHVHLLTTASLPRMLASPPGFAPFFLSVLPACHPLVLSSLPLPSLPSPGPADTHTFRVSSIPSFALDAAHFD